MLLLLVLLYLIAAVMAFVPMKQSILLPSTTTTPSSSSSSSSSSRREEASRLFHHHSSHPPFVQGKELSTLREDLASLENNLKWSLATDDLTRVVALQRAIEQKQKKDPDRVYKDAILKIIKAKGIKKTSKKYRVISKYTRIALEARTYIARLNMEGLWIGKMETNTGTTETLFINVTYHGDTLIAHRVGSTSNPFINDDTVTSLPNNSILLQADLSPQLELKESLKPIALSGITAAKWGTKHLERYPGQGFHPTSSKGAQGASSEGQLIMFEGFFSFLWIPTRQHVFFHRPEPNVVLKLLRDSISKDDEAENTRIHLNRCFQKNIDEAFLGVKSHKDPEDPEPFRRIATEADLETAMRDTQILYDHHAFPVHKIPKFGEWMEKEQNDVISSFLNFHRWMNYVDRALKPNSEGSSSPETQH